MFSRLFAVVLLMAGLALAQGGRAYYHEEVDEEEVNESKKFPLGEVFCAYVCLRPIHPGHDDCNTDCDKHSHSPEQTFKLTQQKAEEVAKSFVDSFVDTESTETSVSAGVSVAPPEAIGGTGASLGGSASRKNESARSGSTEKSVKVSSTITLESELKPSVHHDEPCTTKKAKWGVQVSIQGKIVKRVLRGYIDYGRNLVQAPEKVISISGELTVFVTLYQDEPTSTVKCSCKAKGVPGKPAKDGGAGNDDAGSGGRDGCKSGDAGTPGAEERTGSRLEAPRSEIVTVIDATRRSERDRTVIQIEGVSVYTLPSTGFDAQAAAAARLERMQSQGPVLPDPQAAGCGGGLRLR